LERLAANENSYRVWTVKTGGKERHLEVPDTALEKIHRRLFQLLVRIEKPDYLHSGVSGRSYITNAKVHLGLFPVVKMDIKKFFHSVDGERISKCLIREFGCSPDVAALLRRLCTFKNHVPIGSCVSQLLAFYAAKPMFDALHALAENLNLRDSYYVDDLTWSGRNATPAFLWKAKQIIHRHGFAYHQDRFFAASDKKLVTGVILDSKRALVPPSKEFELWKNIQTLAGFEPLERIAAINSLIGSSAAASQIEERFLRRLKQLKKLKANAFAEIFKSSSTN
jgi:hypothetical protein